MKIKNKNNGVEAEVPDTLGGILVAAGGWEAVGGEAPVEKPARKRAAKKVAPAVEE